MHRSFYIAGPMTGYVEHNYPTFNHVAQALRIAGHTVMNPADNFNGDRFRSRSDYLRQDIKDLLNVEVVLLLPGWLESPGACLEATIAYNLGLDFAEWDFEDDRYYYVGTEDHVRNILPSMYFPAHHPQALAPDGTKQPEVWKKDRPHSSHIPFEDACAACGEVMVTEGGLTEAARQVCVHAEPIEPKPLMADDVCRVCFHGPHLGAECKEVDPVDINPEGYHCGCSEYVDAEAESLIVVHPETVLEEAQRIVLGPRQSSYNHPDQDFRTTGRQWGALVENWLLAEHPEVLANGQMPDIAPRIVALMMAALKASREAHKPKRDNRVDGPGYWFCADRIETGR